MDLSQSLSIDSFSYSWLVNLKPSSLEGLENASIDTTDEASFIEMDPKLPPSKRFFIAPQDVSFNFPMSDSPLTLVHADELISNGLLMPLFANPLKMEPYDEAAGCKSSTPFSSRHRTEVHPLRNNDRVRCSSLRRYHRLSKRVLQRYVEFLRPLCQKIIRSGQPRSTSSRETRGAFACKTTTRMHGREVKEGECSTATSPRSSSVASCPVDNWRRSCDSESSIYEAVLHCKRTIGR